MEAIKSNGTTAASVIVTQSESVNSIPIMTGMHTSQCYLQIELNIKNAS
jgi:hypothetical protein